MGSIGTLAVIQRLERVEKTLWYPWQSCTVNEQQEHFIPLPDVAVALDVGISRVHRLIEDRYLAAKRINNIRMIPSAFIDQGEPIPGVRGTLILLEDLGFTNDEAIDWMLSDNDELGEPPIDALRKGHKAPVRRAVQMMA